MLVREEEVYSRRGRLWSTKMTCWSMRYSQNSPSSYGRPCPPRRRSTSFVVETSLYYDGTTPDPSPVHLERKTKQNPVVLSNISCRRLLQSQGSGRVRKPVQRTLILYLPLWSLKGVLRVFGTPVH